MRRRQQLEDAILEGSLNAARELRRLAVDQSQSIDVFRIIVDQNLWLLFQPLDNLLGAYTREGPGGILVNTRRPLSVQRLTAAHEYGHHILNHRGSLDDEQNLASPNLQNEVEEAAAQSFAADFLMPPQLVNHLWEEFNVPDEPSPYHVYLLALAMGTSYEATTYQLAAQGKIHPLTGVALRKTTPKQIKQQIGGGIGPTNPWAEVWPIDESFAGRSIRIGVEDEVSLALCENPSTGYLWEINRGSLLDLRENAAIADERHQTQGIPPLALLRTIYDPVEAFKIEGNIGGSGHRYITLRALRQAQTTIFEAILRRPWHRQPIERFSVNIEIKGKPTGEAGQGYLEESKTRDLALSGQAS